MSDTSGIKAGRAYVELGVGDKLASGLNKAKARLQSFGKGMTTWGSKLALAAGALAGPATAAAVAFAAAGSKVYDAAARTGMSTEAISGLGYAAQMAGSDMNTVEKSIRKMQKTIADAGQGSKTAAKALAVVGLTVTDLQGLNPDEQFTLVAEAISRLTDPGERAAAALSLLGRSGAGLLPMMEKGAAGIAAAREEARRLGITMSGEDAAAADALGDAFDKVRAVGASLVRGFAAALAPALTDLAERAAVLGAVAGRWLKNNRGLIVSVVQLAAGAAALGVAVALAGKAIGLFAVGIGLVGSLLAFMLSPITLIVAAVGGLATAFFVFTDSGQKALGWLAEGFATLKTDALAAWGGIGDALATGDIAGAARILWATLKVEWQRGVSALTSLWIAFRDSFSDIMSSLGPILMEVGRRIVETMAAVAVKGGKALFEGLKNYGAISGIKEATLDGREKAAIQYQRNVQEYRKQGQAGVRSPEKTDQLILAAGARWRKLDADLVKSEEAAIAKVTGDSGPGLGDALKDIWSKPLPSLDTKKFEDRMKGIGLDPEDQKKVDAANAALATAVEDRDKLLKDATDAQDYQEYLKEMEADVPGPTKGGIFDRIKAGGIAAEAAQKTTIAGTFNAVRLAGFGTSDTLGKVAAATERTADNTDDMAEALEDATEFG